MAEHDSFDFSENQKRKMRAVLEGKIDKCQLLLKPEQLVGGTDQLVLPILQYNKVIEAIDKGTGMRLEVTKKLMQMNQKGGFLGSLLGSLLEPAISSTIGHISKAISGDGYKQGYGLGKKMCQSCTPREREVMMQHLESLPMSGEGIGDDIKDFFKGFAKGFVSMFTDPVGTIKSLVEKKPIGRGVRGRGLTFY